MAITDLRNTIARSTVARTGYTGAVINGPRFAKAFGRTHASQGVSAATQRILGQVASGIFTADDLGIAYPSGTLWVRVQTVYNNTPPGDGFDDSATYWFPVPDTLPSGYTYTPRRNPATMSFGAVRLSTPGNGDPFYPHTAPGSEVSANFLPQYSVSTGPSSSEFFRTADGLYEPQSLTVSRSGITHTWGPWAPGGNGTMSYDMGNLSTSTTVTSIGSPRYMPLHPGYRNIRIKASITSNYGGLPADTTLKCWIDGVLYNFPKSGMIFTGGTVYSTTLDIGPTTMAAAGELRQFTFDSQITGTGLPVGTYGNTRLDLYCSPRVDIPLPWSTTSGNLHAPGGLITGGNVPGY